MSFYYYIYLIILCLIIIFLACSFLWRKKDISAGLFAEALKDENSGHYEAAVVTYENALDEVKKTRFHGDLKNKIIEKLKVLHLFIEYQNRFHLTR